MTDASGGHDIAIYKRLGTGDVEPVEWTLFGTGRMGVSRDVASSKSGDVSYRRVGTKLYELTDHLGSVRALVPDIKLPSGGSYIVEPVSIYEYDAYGIARVTRSADLKEPYRYGFQGMLRMSEVAPSTTIVNDYATLFRTYDARTGRWTSHDPILQPWESTYAGLAGNPAMLTDWLGLTTGGGDQRVPGNSDASKPDGNSAPPQPSTAQPGGGQQTTAMMPMPAIVSDVYILNKQSNGDETPTTESEGVRYYEKFKETANSVGSLRLAQEDINIFEGKNLYQNPVRMKDGSTYRISRKSPGSRAMIELGISWQKDDGTWAWDWVPWTTPQTRAERLIKQNELLDRAPLELTHYGLDVAGYIPGIGEPFDFINGSIYTAERDYLNAGVSYAGMIPILGWAKRPLKLAVEAMLPLGLGSTGRTVARTLTEELAMKEVMSNPLMANRAMRMAPLSDPRWKGWTKMNYTHEFVGKSGITEQVTIHFNAKIENGVIEAVDDFKFVD